MMLLLMGTHSDETSWRKNGKNCHSDFCASFFAAIVQ